MLSAVSVALSLVIVFRIAHGHDMPVPMNIQVPLLMKVLAADRKLAERSGDELVIGVFYQPRLRESVTAMESFVETAGHELPSPIPNQKVAVVAVPLERAPNWGADIAALQLDVCYLTPVRALDIEEFLTAARENGTITCTGVPEYVETGVAVGFDVKGGKPQIVINMKAAKSEGIDFSSQLLKLARIIEKD